MTPAGRAFPDGFVWGSATADRFARFCARAAATWAAPWPGPAL